MILFRLQLAGIQVNLVNLRLNLQIYNVFQVATTFWRQKLSPRVSPALCQDNASRSSSTLSRPSSLKAVVQSLPATSSRRHAWVGEVNLAPQGNSDAHEV